MTDCLPKLMHGMTPEQLDEAANLQAAYDLLQEEMVAVQTRPVAAQTRSSRVDACRAHEALDYNTRLAIALSLSELERSSRVDASTQCEY